MDKLAAMRTFTTVVETGSFTRAAEVLALPKARVSQRVSDLEHHLGIRLLERTTRTQSLTYDGHIYFAKCKAVLDDIDEMEDTLKGHTTGVRGKLRVDALASIARCLIAPHLHEFQALYPSISIRLAGSDRIGHLLEDGLDCAIRGGRLEDSSLIARHVCDVQMGLYAAPSYLGATSPISQPQELIRQRLLSWFAGHRSPFTWQLENGDNTITLPSTDGLLFDDPDVAIASCIAGGGICPGAPFAVESWVRAGALVPVLPEWHFAARSIHIIYPSNKLLSTRVRYFVDWSFNLMKASRSLHMSPAALANSLI